MRGPILDHVKPRHGKTVEGKDVYAGKPRARARKGEGTWKVDCSQPQRRVPRSAAADAQSGAGQPERAGTTNHLGAHRAATCAHDTRCTLHIPLCLICTISLCASFTV